jgi:hypothetical protein
LQKSALVPTSFAFSSNDLPGRSPDRRAGAARCLRRETGTGLEDVAGMIGGFRFGGEAGPLLDIAMSTQAE